MSLVSGHSCGHLKAHLDTKTFFIILIMFHSFHGSRWTQYASPSVWGQARFIALLLERRSANAEAMGSNPVIPLIFVFWFIYNCLLRWLYLLTLFAKSCLDVITDPLRLCPDESYSFSVKFKFSLKPWHLLNNSFMGFGFLGRWRTVSRVYLYQGMLRD